MALNFRKDDVLFREGEASAFVYRLVSGHAEVTKGIVHDNDAIGTLVPGDFVGEIGALVGCPRGATVRFTIDSTLEQYSRADFLHFIAGDPVESMRLLHALSLRTRVMVEHTNHVSAIERIVPIERTPALVRITRLLTALSVTLVDALRRTVKFAPREFGSRLAAPQRGVTPFKTFRRGQILFEEGAPSAVVYLIKSGVVEVSRDAIRGPRLIGRLKAGDFVGEMGVLEARPRSATAAAHNKVVAQELSPEEFHTLMTTSRSVYFQLIDALCERSQRLSRQLHDWHTQATGARQASGATFYDAVSSMESLAQLAEQRLMNDALNVKRFFLNQVDQGREMVSIYQKYLRGEATKDEMERANGHFRDYLKLAGLGTLLILPGAVLTIPLAVKMGKVLGVEVLPASIDDHGPNHHRNRAG